MSDPMVDDFDLYAIWHVRHSDGSEEDIRLDHGNLIEDAKGSCGQVIFYRRHDDKKDGGRRGEV